MRISRGDKVEVLSKHEVPSGAWRAAVIICGNGRNYNVKYEGGFDGIDRVSRKSIRPYPPPLVQKSEDWETGNVVEVFDNFSWKMAKVLKVLGKDNILVRLLGSSLEFLKNKIDIRVRQSWQNDEWVLIGKDSGSCEDEKNGEKSNLKFSHIQSVKSRVNLKKKDEGATLKKSLSKSSKRMRFPQVQGSNAYVYETTKRRKLTGAVKSDENNSVTCSVGSCTVNSNSFSPFPGKLSSVRVGDSSDAESCCGSGYGDSNNLSPSKEELAAEVHRLELHAYRCTIGALHASGPLSWEQETMVTNLRLSLHISNDEHLTEVKHLVSTGAKWKACPTCFQITYEKSSYWGLPPYSLCDQSPIYMAVVLVFSDFRELVSP